MALATTIFPSQLELRRQREVHVLNVVRCLAVIASIVLLPSALRYQFGFSSYAPGVVIGCVLVTVLGASGILGRVPGRVLIKGWVTALLGILAIAIHFGLSLLQWAADVERAITSIAALTVMVAATPIVFYTVFEAENEVIGDALAIMRVAFVIMFILGILGLQPLGPLTSERPVWPFTEPSHFALAAIPFFIDGAVRASRLIRWMWLGVMALMLLLLQSLSLGVGLVIAAACSLGLAELTVFGILAVIGLGFIDLTYYTDRLTIGYDSTNLSALVYLQGIELTQEALETTHGWGIAFQQLGFAPTNVLATEVIRRVGGGEQNLSDGSFLAVKFGAELGILGLIALAIYLFRLFWAIIDLRLVAGRRASAPVGLVFALSVFAAFFVELFVRGIGYFSGTFVMACASLGIVMTVKFMPQPLAHSSSDHTHAT